MKFKIKEEATEDNIELWLEDNIGRIFLKGRNKDGTKETIMRFEKGKFYRIVNIELKGLETNTSGQILVGE